MRLIVVISVKQRRFDTREQEQSTLTEDVEKRTLLLLVSGSVVAVANVVIAV